MASLQGEKINLRPIERTDLDFLNQWKNKEDVYMYLGGGFQPVSKDQQANWMDSMIDLTGNNRRFMIVQEGKTVGMVGLYNIHWVHRTCEIGIVIGEDQARGKGAATEACRLIENYARNYLNLRKITLKAVTDNKKAVSMWHYLGYRNVGELQEERFINGNYCNLFLMEQFLEHLVGGGINMIS